ncbi:MAG: pyruvate kinase [Clostridiaceae bacterium]|nr:pyruvate kinase [Clostridiaceae bacterium]
MRKTKIICTMGPSTQDDAVLREMMLLGMDVARINFSHGTREMHQKDIQRIKTLREERNLPVALLMDTSGPEVRLGNFEQGNVTLYAGDLFTLTTREIPGNQQCVSITYKNLIDDLEEGMKILLDDGLIEMKVLELTKQEIICQVINGGLVSNHKGVNIPDAKLSIPFISQKDKDDILFGIDQGMDYIAASFVRCAEDILSLRRLCEQHGAGEIKIIAKIENREGVDHLDEILRVSDGIMVARGDLGVEIPISEVPVLQKEIIHKVYRQKKSVITATQMLDSMMKNPRPTRAEANDVANAIFDGTSAIMLSGETAAGKYPAEALRTMIEIAEYAENAIDYHERFLLQGKVGKSDIEDAISHATCMTALDIDAAAVVTVTKSGRTARIISRYRPQCPIIGCTPVQSTYYQMNLLWGVKPLLIREETDTEQLFQNAVESTRKEGYISAGDVVVLTAGIPLGVSGTTNLIRVASVSDRSCDIDREQGTG